MTTADHAVCTPDGATMHTPLDAPALFPSRHIGPRDADIAAMLSTLSAPSVDDFIAQVVPSDIRFDELLDLPDARTEFELLRDLKKIASRNSVYRSCIGMGYHATITPSVVLRNILENPAWYTQYTPYQAELAQGRLEALLNFQTMIADLTGLPLANSSLLDEGTAAAEAMSMSIQIARGKKRKFLVADDCHPQTIEVVRTRARSMGIEILVQSPTDFDTSDPDVAGLLVQYPATDGRIECYKELAERARQSSITVVAAADPLALTLLTPPGEWGADICVGSAQRFGVPMGFGGPHAGFISTHEEHIRKMPGRIVGISRDAHNNPALRLAVQTREQHIKRDRATSNICTAQVLLAVIASFYGVYHGPKGLKEIATRVRTLTQTLRAGLLAQGHEINADLTFDTLRVRVHGGYRKAILAAADLKRINLRDYDDGTLGVTLDETSDRQLVSDLLEVFGGETNADLDALAAQANTEIPAPFKRATPYMQHAVFNEHQSETELLRYMYKLQSRELSLAHSMIPLGSCTMKLNATSEMIPVTWPELGNIHPFAPAEQTRGYAELFESLEAWLSEITGFAAVSLQPNAGSQGEFAGLLAIRAYHESRDEAHRTICLIPNSAHGTNPASAITAGMKVIGVKVSDTGAIDVDDLRLKAEKHKDNLGAVMITYPSTCGVFDDNIRTMCDIVHEFGGLVYLDGANMNAQVGLCRPGDFGADVCHLNLHKTFCIPHGGGGPGVGPIGVNEKLKPFLPGHSVVAPANATESPVGAVSAAPYGSASILPISWSYIAMMGPRGLKKATQAAIISANYMAERLAPHYDILFRGSQGRVAHEFVLDCRAFKKSAAIEIDDIAKRLIDFGFHAPTMSWPVPGTLMIEPTESESKAELDRFCDALITIRKEIAMIESGEYPQDDNPLKGAPHCLHTMTSDEWTHPYTRQIAAYPAKHLKDSKFWAPVGRVDNPYGDRNLACSCPTMGDISECEVSD